ncbi:MAG: 50S ribosomal protein L10 [Alphaproteobacteria bacterium]
MKRSQKQLAVATLKERLESSSSIIVISPRGLTVSESTKLRRELRQQGASFVVTKNTLTKLALQDTAFEKLISLFNGPTAIVYSNDSVAGARGVINFTKNNKDINTDKIEILGGVIDESFVDVNAVKAIADLPSLDELRAKIIGLINAPATKIAGVLKAPSEQIVRIFSAYSAKEQ